MQVVVPGALSGGREGWLPWVHEKLGTPGYHRPAAQPSTTRISSSTQGCTPFCRDEKVHRGAWADHIDQGGDASGMHRLLPLIPFSLLPWRLGFSSLLGHREIHNRFSIAAATTSSPSACFAGNQWISRSFYLSWTWSWRLAWLPKPRPVAACHHDAWICPLVRAAEEPWFPPSSSLLRLTGGSAATRPRRCTGRPSRRRDRCWRRWHRMAQDADQGGDTWTRQSTWYVLKVISLGFVSTEGRLYNRLDSFCCHGSVAS
jgi:hypothetical protein